MNGSIRDLEQALSKKAWSATKFIHHRIGSESGEKRSKDAEVSSLHTPLNCDPHRTVNGADFVGMKSHPAVKNPVLTASDIDDYGDVTYVADPFLFVTDDRWHLFVEVFNADMSPDSVIGHATSSDGTSWQYSGVVLNTGFHVSFPYVFQWDRDHYMLPNQYWGYNDSPKRVSLYKGTPFPDQWTRVEDLVEPDHLVRDTVLFRRDGRWWLLTIDQKTGQLYLYHSRQLLNGEWTRHVETPIEFPHGLTIGGRPVVGADEVLLFVQDCEPEYGSRVFVYRITSLDTETVTYRQVSNTPALKQNGRIGWSSGRMHHVDPWRVNDEWICAVDGDINVGRGRWTGAHWAVGIYTTGDSE